MDTIILFVLALISTVIYYLICRKRRMSILERNGINGPKPHFIYGNMLEVLKNGNVKTHEKWKKEYGPIYGYYSGGFPLVAVTDPKLLKQIQIKEFKNFSNRFFPLKGGFYPDPRNNHMLVKAKDQRWKEIRTIIRQAFTSSRLKNSIQLFDDTVCNLIASIEKKIDEGNPELEIYVLFQGLTMETIGRSAFGITTEAQTNPNDPFLVAAKAVFGTSPAFSKIANYAICFPEFEFIHYPLRRFLEIMFSSPSSRLLKMSSAIVDSRKFIGDTSHNDLLQSMLEAKVKLKELQSFDDSLLSENADMSARNEEEIEASSDKINSHKSMTNDEIVANIVLFLEAGFETTSSALGFVMHILVNHIDVQEKVREEVIQLLEKEGKLDYNTVNQLPFMEAVIYETLRIYPPVTFLVTRVAKVDYKYENITIPKGSSIIVPVYQLHHDPQLWDEPEKFDPHRFYGDNKVKVNDLIWQAFGAGPRNCIGMRFANFEMKLALAKLLAKYRFEPGPRTEIKNLTVKYKSLVMCPSHVYVKASRI